VSIACSEPCAPQSGRHGLRLRARALMIEKPIGANQEEATELIPGWPRSPRRSCR